MTRHHHEPFSKTGAGRDRRNVRRARIAAKRMALDISFLDSLVGAR